MVKLFLFFFLMAAPAMAQEKKLTAEEQKTVEKIEAYFNGIRTIKSKFYQVSDNGGSAQGDFYVSKPNKMRLTYEPPHQIEVVADGHYLIFHDKKLEQVTYLDLDENPAAMILKEDFSFKKEDLTITDMTTEPGIVTVSVIKNNAPSAGRITLIFKDKPLTLRQWSVTDARQITTTVSLGNMETNIAVDNALFKFKDPRRKKRPGDIPDRRR